jgi:hypothetical protein
MTHTDTRCSDENNERKKNDDTHTAKKHNNMRQITLFVSFFFSQIQLHFFCKVCWRATRGYATGDDNVDGEHFFLKTFSVKLRFFFVLSNRVRMRKVAEEKMKKRNCMVAQEHGKKIDSRRREPDIWFAPA